MALPVLDFLLFHVACLYDGQKRRFEGGEIKGRKLEPVQVETLESWPKVRGKVSRASIRESIKAGRR